MEFEIFCIFWEPLFLQVNVTTTMALVLMFAFLFLISEPICLWVKETTTHNTTQQLLPCSCCSQVGVFAPHDDVRNLHCHHEVSLNVFIQKGTASVSNICVFWWIPILSKPCLNACRFNSQILVFVTRQFRSAKPCCPGRGEHRDDKAGEDASACNTSMVLLNKGAARFGQWQEASCKVHWADS